jgi:Cft2 family RNA processing exonuclease
MYLTALGGANEIGASCYLLQTAGYKILVDCGLRPTASGPAALPDLDALPHPDLVFVTHAHLDHSGALPLLRQRFPHLPIMLTAGTQALLKILLADAVKVMGYTRKRAAPLYDMRAVRALLQSLTVIETEKWFHPLSDVAACLAPAGHILGAAMVLLDTPEGRVVFSGDFSLAHQRTVRGARLPDMHADLLVVESTYGALEHPSREHEEQSLARAVGEVIVDGGVALAPSFAVGRAQEVTLTLRAMQRAGAIPEFPIYLDGMVRAVCGAYRRSWQDLSPELQALVEAGEHPFQDRWVRRVSPGMRSQIPRPGEPCCIVSSSGMLNGGPSVGYAQVILDQERNAIIFPGYTDEESPGRRLQQLKAGDSIRLRGKTVPVQAQVRRLNLSAHGDGPQITRLVEHLAPRAVALVHGEPDRQKVLAEALSANWQVHLVANGETLEPLPSPRWLGQTRSRRRHRGRIQYDDDHVVLELDRGVLGEPTWHQLYGRRDEIAARFMGDRLLIEPDKVRPEEEMNGKLLEPVRPREVEVLVQTPKTEVELMAEQWHDSDFACMMCGGAKRYRVDLPERQIEWACSECEAGYEEIIMRLRGKDLERMDKNELLRLLQFIHVSLRLHEPVLPNDWKELVAQRFWERWWEPGDAE